LLLAIVAVASLTFSTWSAPPAIAAPALTGQDKELLAGLAEAYHLSQEKGGKVWPGFDLHKRPLVLFDRNRIAFLINHPKPPQGFVKFTQATPLPLSAPIYVRYGRSPEFEQAGTLGIALNGVPTTLLPYPFFFYDGTVTSRDFVSALFASYIQHGFRQFVSYQKRSDERFNAYPTENVPNMAMADLENKMLAVALQADSLDLAKRNALWFVAMRRERQEKLGKPHAAYEDQAEAIEGATRFSEIMFAAAGNSDYQPLKSPFLKASGYAKESELVRQISGLLHQTVDPNSVRRDRFSLTGSAMALLLDRFGAEGWRQQLTSGGESMDDLLARAVEYSDSQRDRWLTEGRRVYAYERTLAKLEDTVGRMPTSLKTFNASNGTRFTVTLHPVESLVELDSEPSRSGRDGLAIASSASPVEIDAWTLLAFKLDAFDYKKGPLSLLVKGRPILMRSTDLAWPFQNVSFYADTAKLKLTVDGKPSPFQKGSRVFTRGLKIEADGVSLKAGRGTLVVGDREIQVIGR
jgi:hypothetical protein